MSVEISVNEAKCKHDGMCQKVCPMAIFTVNKDKPVNIQTPHECVLCGQCMAVCPTGAIANSRLDLARFRKIDNHHPVTPESFMEVMAQRRSVRIYKNEPVDKSLLEKVLQIAGQAPGSPHQQLGWERHVIVVNSPESMKNVREFTAEYCRRLVKLLDGLMLRTVARFSAEAASARGLLPDLRRRMVDWGNGIDTLTYMAPGAIFCTAPITSSEPQVDCDAALMAILLAAHTYGIGTCWNGLLNRAVSGDHVSNCAQLAAFLGLPEGHKCYAAATFGYAAVKYARIPHRETVIHWV